MIVNRQLFTQLAESLHGELLTDKASRILYATDASIYREIPLAVCLPKSDKDVAKLIAFARENKIGLIARTAGTSLAGQCVGNGIVVDFSRHCNQIIELNVTEKWISVQPGVIRDQLNNFLKPHALFFGPNTSTANRAMIGGMFGNNSCGSYSIVYGDTRAHVLEVKGYLSDGSSVVFKAKTKDEITEIIRQNNAESHIYKELMQLLGDEQLQSLVEANFPDKKVTRRNTGYALDALLDCELWAHTDQKFNLCKLLTGSEGTLFMATEIKLNLVERPPDKISLLCPHFNSVIDSLEAVKEIMGCQPRALELMDKAILDCTKNHPQFKHYRFFVQGEPQAILAIEIGANDNDTLLQKQEELLQLLQSKTKATQISLVDAANISKVWDLRAAGLGLLSNFKGDKKPIALIEDTAVSIDVLPDYIAEFEKLMQSFSQQAVYYAHAGAGELHLRPVLNLKVKEDRILMQQIAHESMRLVKKYKGSLSGEHGDGRLRAAFLQEFYGEQLYEVFKEIKNLFDPENIFNPGKIVEAPPMNEFLRYEEDVDTKKIDTYFSFDETDGYLRAVERCNGSADCRKLPEAGGVMCPSYQATKNEYYTTRGRANLLREVLTHSQAGTEFNSNELLHTLGLCLACKACKTECPSNVDMALFKAEYLAQHYKRNPANLADKMVAHFYELNLFASRFGKFTNAIARLTISQRFLKKLLHTHPSRTLPLTEAQNLRNWYKNQMPVRNENTNKSSKKVLLFIDEFSNFSEVEMGKSIINFLHQLGYAVHLSNLYNSGRTFISKGFLKEAKALSEINLRIIKEELHDENTVILGIEPSCLLGFRDELFRLTDVSESWQQKIQQKVLLIDEFLCQEAEENLFEIPDLSAFNQKIMYHAHCHQKSLSSVDFTLKLFKKMGLDVELIKSGCCGMAGFFGYEKDKHDLSMQIGNMQLFPAINAASQNTVFVASGTSCRHQIKDGAQKSSKHPMEFLNQLCSSNQPN